MMISSLVMSRFVQFTGLTVLTLVYIVFIPFTKVEESFSLQAIHDFIYLGIPRALDIFHRLVPAILDWLGDSKFSLKFHFVPEPINNVHSYNYSEWKWDHEDFPGPLPRSFIGPFLLSLFVFPWSIYLGITHKLIMQILVRATLAMFVLIGFNSYVAAVSQKFGRRTASTLVIITLTQFHILFYASRPLPNTFAFSLCLFASAKWLSQRYTSFIIFVAATVIIFRAETVLLFGCMIAHSIFFQKNLSFVKLFLIGIPAGLIFLMVTILFDSFMWGKWVWPEGYGIYYNVYLNKSADWGVKPYFWYFYSAIPRTLLTSTIFIPFASRRCLSSCLMVSTAFVIFYSFLGHKEARFIFYCLPLLNTCAADTVGIIFSQFSITEKNSESWIVRIFRRCFNSTITSNEMVKSKTSIISSTSLRKRGKNVKSSGDNLDERSPEANQITSRETKSNSLLALFFFTLLTSLILINVGCTIYGAVASYHNYPGGDSVLWTNKYILSDDLKTIKSSGIAVHVCNLAAQTGFSRFVQLNQVTYDKSIDFRTMANKELRITKYKNQTAKFESHDFSILYFILENIDVDYLTQNCSKSNQNTKSSVTTKLADHITKFSVPEKPEKVTCKISSELSECVLIKTINGFHGLRLNRFSNLTVPKLWIFRCETR